MISLDDIRIYLPKFLSEPATVSLFDELARFPKNIDSRVYSLSVAHENSDLLQGDGLPELPVVNLPDPEVRPVNAMVISNSCDMAPANQRLSSSSVCYCPIFKLGNYQASLRSKLGPEYYSRIDQMVTDIRSQRITQTFYLPASGRLDYEGFIFFDRICCCDNQHVDRQRIADRRLFSLSNYGFYLFLIKLSIHFTRVRDGVDRTDTSLAS